MVGAAGVALGVSAPPVQAFETRGGEVVTVPAGTTPIVTKAVQELGGTLTVDSTPGEGTTFRMTLPLTLAIMAA